MNTRDAVWGAVVAINILLSPSYLSDKGVRWRLVATEFESHPLLGADIVSKYEWRLQDE